MDQNSKDSNQRADSEWTEENVGRGIEQSRALIRVIPGIGLVPLGTRKEIKEIGRRVQLMSPQYNYTLVESIALAQYAMSLHANPIPSAGEVWLMKRKPNVEFPTGQVIGFMPGYKLYLRKANEADKERGDRHWFEYGLLTDDEMKLYEIPQGSLAVKAILHNTTVERLWAENVEKIMMNGKGAKFEEAIRIFGDQPHVEGIGYLTKSEIDKLNGGGEIKYPHIERARKRARVAGYKQMYNLDFGFVPIEPGADVEFGQSISDEYIEVKAIPSTPETLPEQEKVEAAPSRFATEPEITPEGQAMIAEMDAAEGATKVDPTETAEQKDISKARAGAAMYGDPPTAPRKRAWHGEQLNYVMRETADKVKAHAQAVLDLSPIAFDSETALPEIDRWHKIYRRIRDAGEKTLAASAQSIAEYEKS